MRCGGRGMNLNTKELIKIIIARCKQGQYSTQIITENLNQKIKETTTTILALLNGYPFRLIGKLNKRCYMILDYFNVEMDIAMIDSQDSITRQTKQRYFSVKDFFKYKQTAYELEKFLIKNYAEVKE